MKFYIINENKLNKLKEALNKPYCFEADGCDCGDFTFELEKNIYLYIYRSCRKSSGTPEGMQWKIHEPSLSERVENKDDTEFCYEPSLFMLNKEQTSLIMALARTRTIKDIGYDEYGNKLYLKEDSKLDKWDELRGYLLSEKDKISNSDDIPQSIYDNILDKMNDFEKENL